MLSSDALVSVADIEARDASHSLPVIEDAISAISADLAAECRRTGWMVAEVQDLLAGSGTRVLQLRRGPIATVSRVVVNGSDVTDYSVLSAAGGTLYRRSGWPRVIGRHPDLTGDPDPSDVLLTVSVEYTAGYPDWESVPPDLRLVCIQEILSTLSRPTNPGLIEEQTAGGWRQKFSGAGVGKLGVDTSRVLSRYTLPAKDDGYF